MRINADRCFALGVLAATLAASGMALIWMNRIARRMPLIIAVYLLVSLGAYFFAELRRKPNPVKDDADAMTASDGRMLGWISLILPLLMVLGLIPGFSFFTTLFYRLEAKRSWRGSIIFGALLWASLWLIFEVALGEDLYAGFREWR